MIVSACGMCGVALDENGAYVSPVPVDYHPDNYPHVWCDSCAYDYQREEHEKELQMEEDNKRWRNENK